MLEQSDITDTEHFIAEGNLWSFLTATQADTLKKLKDDYGTDARDEVFKALRKELEHTSLWMLLRQGLKVRGLEFRLFYPKPRSAASAAAEKHAQNRITFRPHFYFGETNQEIDFVIYLNGLPIVALELKHEANQNVHDAVAQFAKRDHARKIFEHPFLYLAADTSDVMAATDSRREENFRWHNMGLTNTPQTNPDEYPVEFLYREVLCKEQLLEALSFFLVRVPLREEAADKTERPAYTLFPRYHQSRLVRRVAEDITAHFATAGDIGKKYLADHSAGSGKTLSICWLADRLHSLFKPGTNDKILYAFSDFTHPETNAEIHEHAVNELKDGELIEERFEGEDYRLMIVANKFQTGFDQPLLAGMFLDKPVVDRNAVQTLSRLNRCHDGKQDVVVVDFTNNATAILKAFQKYRKGTPFVPEEPDKELCPKLYADVLAVDVFTQKDAADFAKLVVTGTDAQVQFFVNALRTRFQTKIADTEDRKSFVYLLARYVKAFHFLTCFFSYAPELKEFATFAEYVGPQLIKQGSVSDLMKQIRQTEVIKAAVEYQGVTTSAGPVKLQPGKGKTGTGPTPQKVSVQDMIAAIRAKFDITDEEALYIKQVTEEKSTDPAIRSTVTAHREDGIYLEGAYRGQVNGEIQTAYSERERYEELGDLDYIREGGIFDIMAVTVIQTHLSLAA